MRFAWFVLLLLVLANGWVLWHRHVGFAYKHFVSYDALYVGEEMWFVKHVSLANNQGVISLSQPTEGPKQWRLIVDSIREGSVEAKDHQLRFALLPGRHHYWFLGNDSLEAINFYVVIDNSCGRKPVPGCLNELLRLSLPMPTIAVKPVAYWVNTKTFAAAEVARGTQLMPATQKGASTFDKLQQIGTLISRMKVSTDTSQLTAAMLESYPTDSLVKRVIAQNTALICGNFSYFFHYLSSSQQVANRFVQFADDGDGWSFGVHYLNEVYVPEKNGWGMVDAMHNLYLPHDSVGRLITTAEVNAILTSGGSLQGLLGYAMYRDSLVEKPLAHWQKPLQLYYANPNSILSYWPANAKKSNTLWSRIGKFYGFDTTKYSFSNRYENNWSRILLKLFLFAALMLVGLYVLYQYLLGLTGKKRKHLIKPICFRMHT